MRSVKLNRHECYEPNMSTSAILDFPNVTFYIVQWNVPFANNAYFFNYLFLLMAPNFLALATTLENLGARWLLAKKVNFVPCLMCFFFSVSWSRAYGLCGLSLYTSNDLTYNSIRFKKPLDIFWPANSKKRFRRLFSYDFGCKQKALSDFLASSSSWKRANTGKPA